MFRFMIIRDMNRSVKISVTEEQTLTFGSSREASTPGLRFLKSLNIPSSNFFMFRTGRPKAY